MADKRLSKKRVPTRNDPIELLPGTYLIARDHKSWWVLEFNGRDMVVSTTIRPNAIVGAIRIGDGVYWLNRGAPFTPATPLIYLRNGREPVEVYHITHQPQPSRPSVIVAPQQQQEPSMGLAPPTTPFQRGYAPRAHSPSIPSAAGSEAQLPPLEDERPLTMPEWYLFWNLSIHDSKYRWTPSELQTKQVQNPFALVPRSTAPVVSALPGPTRRPRTQQRGEQPYPVVRREPIPLANGDYLTRREGGYWFLSLDYPHSSLLAIAIDEDLPAEYESLERLPDGIYYPNPNNRPTRDPTLPFIIVQDGQEPVERRSAEPETTPQQSHQPQLGAAQDGPSQLPNMRWNVPSPSQLAPPMPVQAPRGRRRPSGAARGPYQRPPRNPAPMAPQLSPRMATAPSHQPRSEHRPTPQQSGSQPSQRVPGVVDNSSSDEEEAQLVIDEDDHEPEVPQAQGGRGRGQGAGGSGSGQGAGGPRSPI